jgi:hypothetical protein
MSRPLCSVVLATFNRAHLLRRSLECYARQSFPRDEFELVVIDDHSTDGTRELVLDWSATTKISAVVVTTSPKPGYWVDCGHCLNAGIRAATGQHVLLTHPEVMPGRMSVQRLVRHLGSFEDTRSGGAIDRAIVHDGPLPLRKGHPIGLYAACKVYYLSPRDQELIDTVPWQDEGNLALRKIAGFYDEDANGNPDYTHAVTDQVATLGFRIQTWDSWVFGGCSRQTWKLLGGMLESQRWGSVDVLWNDRRKKLGMAEWTCPDDDSICAHQNHDGPLDVKTPRDEDAWKDECSTFDHRSEALTYPAVDNLGWG